MEKEENMNSESRKWKVKCCYIQYNVGEKRIRETNKEIIEKLVGLITSWQRKLVDPRGVYVAI
jgi:hypothetical protein